MRSEIEQSNVGDWRRKLDLASWDGRWLKFTDVSVGYSLLLIAYGTRLLWVVCSHSQNCGKLPACGT